MRKHKKKEPHPEAVRFSYVAERVVPGFTLCNLSEADIRDLNAGVVPNWLILTTDLWLRDNPKPSDVPPVIP